MAFLLPENIPSRNGIPKRLQDTAKCLRDLLPDTVTVWLAPAEVAVAPLERTAAQSTKVRPYLVVLDPTAAGILLLETPSLRGPASHVKESNPKLSTVEVLTELSKYKENLREALDRSSLEHLPVKRALAFPDMDRDGLPNSTTQSKNLPVLSYENFASSETLTYAFDHIFKGATGALDARGEAAARAAVNPEIILPSKQGNTVALFSDPEVSPEDVIPVIDREQERVAEHLGEGYRVLRGVAGSGKTLLLRHRARHLARLYPDWRILILCYNRILANRLDDMVADMDQITANNVDRLAFSLSQNKRKPAFNRNVAFDENISAAVEVAKGLPDPERYDVVLVDEAQDFTLEGLDLAYAMLKSDRDHFVMALDSAQNLYRRRGMSWNPKVETAPGKPLTARGRTKIFRINYRNTQEILQTAMGLLIPNSEWKTSSSTVNQDSEVLIQKIESDPEMVIPPEAAKRCGSVPKVLECKDLCDEANTIVSQIKMLLSQDVNPDSIVVMYGSKAFQNQLYRAFIRHKIPYLWLQYEKDRKKVNRDKAFRVEKIVRVSTLFGLKGLEFSRVFIGAVNEIFIPQIEETDQLDAAKKLLYVGMTRAQDELTITVSGDGPIGAALRSAKASV